MENLAFDIWLNSRMEFSEDDRRECFATAKEIVQIAIDVRKHGLLAIDDKIPQMDDLLM